MFIFLKENYPSVLYDNVVNTTQNFSSFLQLYKNIIDFFLIMTIPGNLSISLVEVIDLEIRRIICSELNGSYVIFKYGDSFLSSFLIFYLFFYHRITLCRTHSICDMYAVLLIFRRENSILHHNIWS